MSHLSSRRTTPTWRLILAVTIIALVFSTIGPAAVTPAAASGNIEQLQTLARDTDYRTGTVAPTSTQKTMVSQMGASVSWNRFGTPQSLIRYGGFLATGLTGDTAAQVARNWLGAKRSLFRLSSVSATELELVNDSQMPRSAVHAVTFRQKFGGLPATRDGMVTVGLSGSKAAGWRIAYVSSSLRTSSGLAAPTSLNAREAWLKAAASVGKSFPATSIMQSKQEARTGWTTLSVKGLAQVQRARLTALPTYTQGVRPAYEAIVLDVRGGRADAYRVYVDAATGKVWLRENLVDQIADFAPQATTFTGTYSDAPAPRACGSTHSFTVGTGMKSITVVATATIPSNDIVLKLIYNGTVVASSDTATSPEAVRYAPTGGVPAGVYQVQVCPYASPTAPPVAPYTYAGSFIASDTDASGVPYPPKWKYFRAYPTLDYSPTDTRVIGCWESIVDGMRIPGCELTLKNLASRAPWDYDLRANLPTFTTKGNNAYSAEAWSSPLTPGATHYSPVSADRSYVYPWQNQWYTSKCAPSALASANRNDVDAAAANLFASHNRMHDWSYFLGFTEQNYNMQDSNLGNTAPGPYPLGREADPELGDVQAGALSGGYPSFLGRDNANQITLNDGIAPITNMYLWQPIAAAFYGPCVDGDFDMSVIGHEYTHAISNRMVGGPDSGLSGAQAGSMGESWSDLSAVEYLAENGYAPIAGENRFAVGAYVTGNPRSGIRNYGMNASPLNYSDLGYDPNGATSPHADGEIWSAVNFDIRRALVAKYNVSYPESNLSLQRSCAAGSTPVTACPGNRRWLQIVYDAFLLMSPGVSMLDARDAYLAADMLRFNGANQKELWLTFARRGMGRWASSTGSDDPDARPNFMTPIAPTTNATVAFDTVASNARNAHVNARVFVGKYEARAMPIADTYGATALPSTARFAPGTYEFLVQAPGYGAVRFSRTFTAGQNVKLTVAMPTNWASSSQGAMAYGSGVNQSKLIDDTEATNWAVLNATSVRGQTVTVNLAGGSRLVTRVAVSALLRPTNASDPGGDTGAQSRFSALRQFEIWTCVASPSNAGCGSSTAFRKVYTSPANAFPSGRPRPLAPDLTLRTFDIPDVTATHVQLRVVTNQCTGAPAYQGEQDNDPLNVTDCSAGSTQDQVVRAAELQVFSSNPAVRSSTP